MPTPSDVRERNRELMPETAAWIAELRASLLRVDPEAKTLAWGRHEENGHTVEWGTRVPDRVPG